ncbi:MAG: hypothetical protein QOI11_1657 [Candidatus Eremiobacteraeota bacterium]|jgi:hypothetical protein|nr:hypothetical protein [Candidatus Eremiobacteraeota bacterium]
MSKYVIQLKKNPNYCLGVSTLAAGAAVQLTLLRGAGDLMTQWIADPNTGVLTLAASLPGDELVLDYEGTSASNGTKLMINPLVFLRPSQTWNWVGNMPYIMSGGAPAYAIDDPNGSSTPGTTVQLWTQKTGETNQQWTLLAVSSLERHAASLARHAAAPAR